ncbi:MAG: transcription termination/antitermination protein NusG [Beijerinckiaceae bacterium]
MTTASLARSWYVVQAQPNREMRAVHELLAQGFEVFLPRYLRQCRHARRITQAAAPLFPGYFFVAFDAAVQRWRSINGTIGVVRLITSLEQPSPIARGVVEGLMARCDAQGYIPLPSRSAFEPGEAVRISDGSFAESLGLFEEIRGQNRIAILLELLGRKVRVLIDEGMVEKAA